MPVGIGNQVNIFAKYPNGVYWQDLPENEKWMADGRCVHCWHKAHVGTCNYCHEVIHGQNFYSTVEEGTRVWFHPDCRYAWVREMIKEVERERRNEWRRKRYAERKNNKTLAKR